MGAQADNEEGSVRGEKEEVQMQHLQIHLYKLQLGRRLYQQVKEKLLLFIKTDRRCFSKHAS